MERYKAIMELLFFYISSTDELKQVVETAVGKVSTAIILKLIYNFEQFNYV